MDNKEDIHLEGGDSIIHGQWRDISAFDALDESWMEPQAAETLKGQIEEGPINNEDILTESQLDKRSGSSHNNEENHTQTISTDSDQIASSSSTAKLSPLRSSRKINLILSKTVGPEIDWKYVQSSSTNQRDDTAKRRRGRIRRRSSGAMTDTELLQPGPSGPSLRIPSHKLPSQQSAETIELQSSDDHALPPKASSVPSSPSLSTSIAFQDPISPSRTVRSSSTSSSGEKQGAHIFTQSTNPIPPLTSQRVTALKMLDSRSHQPNQPNDSIMNGDQFDSAREDVSASQAAVTAVEITFIEHSNIASPPAFLKPAWANKNKKGRARDIFAPIALQTMFEPPSDTSRLAWRTSTEEDGSAKQDSVNAEVQANENAEDIEEVSETDEAEVSSESVNNQNDIPIQDDVAEERDSATASQPTSQNDIPHCTFTFSSPVVQPKRPPPTPSTSHAPLRLFQLNGRNPEIEQILNTPRSAVKARDAKRIVWKLVEEEGRGEREKKRLRMDRMPTGEILSNLQELDEIPNSEETNLHANSRLLDRIRAVGNNSTNRTISSSLIANRKGAKAPTPERAMQYRRIVPNYSPLRRGESPRKLLRRWSAANQVDEEIETEGNQLDLSTADDAWQDLADEDGPSRIPSTSSNIAPMVRIPSVSIEPPNSPDSTDKIETITTTAKQDLIAALAKSTSQPGMLHISPDAIPLQEIEAMSNGKMTFDRKMNRWIRTRQLQKRSGKTNGDSMIEEDTTDPFHDFESIPSLAGNALQRRAMNSSFIKSKNSLKKSSTNDNLVPPLKWSPQSLASSGALLTPAKNNLTDPHRSATPRSILKSAGAASRWPMNDVTPTITRQANRKISFADNVAPVHRRSKAQDDVEERKDLIRTLIHELSLVALGPEDDSYLVKGVEEYHSIQHSDQDSFEDRPSFTNSLRTPKANKSASFAAASMAQRSPWNLSMLRGSNRKRDLENGHASFLTNASFNLAHDRMLQIITDVAPWTTRWHSMRSIDLRGRRVDSLVRIDEFLPRLEEALLDDNEIEYLTGLPNSLRHLSIARNRLPTTAAFGHLDNLESLDVSDNNIDLRALRNLSQLRYLRANNNRLRSIQGVQNLEKLESLHLRNNQIGELEVEEGQWPCLQDFVLSRNRLQHIKGLDFLSQLRSLNLDHNQLTEVDLGIQMPKLKQLRVSGNHQLAYLDVAAATNLRTLYADECSLDEVTNIGALSKLDNLSLRQQSGQNGLQWPAHDIRDVKRLFLSGNAFRAADMANAKERSRNIFVLPTVPSSHNITQFFGLVYLELSGCQLTSLPLDLAEMVPNLRQLNADYNLLKSLPRMNKMQRLKRLSLVGCRINRSRKLVESLQGCEELNLLDVRMNPCTLGLYPPIIVAHPRGTKINRAFLPPIPHPFFTASQDVEDDENKGEIDLVQGMGSLGEKSFFHKRRPPPAMTMMGEESRLNFDDEKEKEDQTETIFAASDLRFATTLPPNFKLQRLLHRGSLAMACENLTWLDGLLIDELEVQQADECFRQGKGKEYLSDDDDDGYSGDPYQDNLRKGGERSDSILSSESEIA